MFANCGTLGPIEKLDLSGFNTENVENMASMFRNIPIKDLDLENFNTSKVTDMNGMFIGMPNIEKLDLRSFDVSNVRAMNDMFSRMGNLKELLLPEQWDTSNVDDMTNMLRGLTSLEDLSVLDMDMSGVDRARNILTGATGIQRAAAKKKGIVTFTKAKNAKNITVPKTVKLRDGRRYIVKTVGKKAFTAKKIRKVTVGANVTKLAKQAFAKSKAKTLVLKTKKLKKASVKGSLKGSRITKIKVSAGKKYVKKYKKIFTKKNCGKKVKVAR